MRSFRELLRPELLISIDGNRSAVVKESDRSAVLRRLEIRDLPGDCIVFELDHTPTGHLKSKLKNAFKQLSCLINDQHASANKSCDFVVVSEGPDGLTILLGDLKSLNPHKGSCVAQLKNSELFVRYLVSLINEYHEAAQIALVRKVVVYVAKPLVAKAFTQQRNLPEPSNFDGVVFFPVVIGNLNVGGAVVSYNRLT